MTTIASARLVVLISGNGSNLQAIIDHIESGKLNAIISLVISNNKNAYGIIRAQQHNIPTRIAVPDPEETRQQYDCRLIKIIDDIDYDYIVLAGFMKILSDNFVDHYKGCLLNIHPSLLPRYKGLNTHQRVLDAGEKIHGASVHFVTPTLDSGPIIMQVAVDISPGDTPATLANRVLKKEHSLYSHVLSMCIDETVELSGKHVFVNGRKINKPLILESE